MCFQVREYTRPIIHATNILTCMHDFPKIRDLVKKTSSNHAVKVLEYLCSSLARGACAEKDIIILYPLFD